VELDILEECAQQETPVGTVLRLFNELRKIVRDTRQRVGSPSERRSHRADCTQVRAEEDRTRL
jgi:hypothetical protein